jgi:SAM-dependent methyltransferase
MDLPRLLRSPFRRPPPDTDRAFAEWLASEAGQAMLAEQRALLADVLVRAVGYHALQCGVGRAEYLLDATRIRRRHYLGRPGDEGASLYADPASLPFANHSLDLVLLHHSLDFEANPHEVLRETTRSLIPGGTLVVVGFNPFSLWGLARLFRLGSGRLPWLARFLPAQRVHDWLGVLGLELEGYESGHYVLPLADSAPRRFSLIARFGQRFWPRRGAFYILVARKRAAMIRPLRPRFALPERSPQVIPVPLAHWRRRIRPDQEGSEH